MKNILRLLIFFMVYNHMIYGQLSWERTSGPYAGNVNTLVQDENGNIYAGTTGGGIYRMKNEDSVWTHLDRKLNFGGIRDIKISDENVLYAASNSGIYQSSDQGETWTLGSDGLNPQFCRSVGIYNKDTIFAGTNGQGVYRSDDGGMTWTQKSEGLGNHQIWVLKISDENEIYATAYNAGIFRSMDKGESWEVLNNGLTHLIVNDLLISKSGYLYAGTINGVFRSIDNGMNWEKIMGGGCTALKESADGIIYAGFLEKIVITADGGETLEEIPLSEGYLGVSDFLFLEEGEILISNTSNGVFDLGEDGTVSPVNQGFTNVDITSVITDQDNNLFVGGQSGIHHSQDLGNTWDKIGNGNIAGNIEVLYYSPDAILFAGTNSSGMAYSNDGGNTWLRPEGGLENNQIRSFTSTSTGDIYAGTSDGELYRSQDGGKNWQKIETGFPIASMDILGTNAQDHIFAGLLGEGVYRSEDNGNSWIQVNNGLPEGYRPKSFLFLDSEIWVGGFSGVFRSMDNGDSWDDQNFLYQIYDLRMDAEGSVYAGTRSFGVHRMEKGSDTWENVSTGLEHLDISSLNMITDSILYAGTQGGGLFKTIIEKSTVSVSDPEFPDGLSLSPNSPNPFREATTIHYTIPKSGSVVLRIYDMMGREVNAVMSQENHPPGRHSISLTSGEEGLNLIHPGIYFLTLTFDHQYNLTRRIIKVR